MECGGLPPLWRSDPGPVGRHAFSLEALSREKAAAIRLRRTQSKRGFASCMLSGPSCPSCKSCLTLTGFPHERHVRAPGPRDETGEGAGPTHPPAVPTASRMPPQAAMECGGLPPLWRSDPGPVGRHAFSLRALSREKAAAIRLRRTQSKRGFASCMLSGPSCPFCKSCLTLTGVPTDGTSALPGRATRPARAPVPHIRRPFRPLPACRRRRPWSAAACRRFGAVTRARSVGTRSPWKPCRGKKRQQAAAVQKRLRLVHVVRSTLSIL